MGNLGICPGALEPRGALCDWVYIYIFSSWPWTPVVDPGCIEIAHPAPTSVGGPGCIAIAILFTFIKIILFEYVIFSSHVVTPPLWLFGAPQGRRASPIENP